MPDCQRKSKQYPPSMPAATLWAAECCPLAQRRMPVMPLIRLSAVDHLPQQHARHEPRRRPQTPPPAYTGTLPPRYEDIAYSSDDDDDDAPLALLQQQRTNSADDHEPLDRLKQRLTSATPV